MDWLKQRAGLLGLDRGAGKARSEKKTQKIPRWYEHSSFAGPRGPKSQEALCLSDAAKCKGSIRTCRLAPIWLPLHLPRRKIPNSLLDLQETLLQA